MNTIADINLNEKLYTLFSSNNEIYFTGLINNESMSELIKIIKKLETEIYNKNKEINKQISDLQIDAQYFQPIEIKINPIKLTINSTGGSVYAAFFAVDIIQNLKIDIHTIVCGYCASAATILSLSGKKKYITKNSNMLIHEIRAGYWGKISFINDTHENLTKLSLQLIEFYKLNTKLTEIDLKEILERDKNWSALECLEKGLVDEII
jgi:ATP-dependent Clp protease protease subunit